MAVTSPTRSSQAVAAQLVDDQAGVRGVAGVDKAGDGLEHLAVGGGVEVLGAQPGQGCLAGGLCRSCPVAAWCPTPPPRPRRCAVPACVARAPVRTHGGQLAPSVGRSATTRRGPLRVSQKTPQRCRGDPLASPDVDPGRAEFAPIWVVKKLMERALTAGGTRPPSAMACGRLGRGSGAVEVLTPWWTCWRCRSWPRW